MDRRDQHGIVAAVRQIRDQVGEILKKCPDCAGEAAEILLALSLIEDGSMAGSVPSGTRASNNDRPRRNKPKAYAREEVGGAEVLAEYRDDSPLPLRASKAVFDEVVSILAKADKPMPFRAVQTQLRDRFTEEPAEYQARIVLRYLQSPQIKLITRRNASYRATDPKKIRRAAKDAWDKLSA